MRDGVADDVGQVVVDQPVEHFAARSFAFHHTRGLEDPKVLADKRLGHSECVDQLVNAALRLEKLQYDRDPHRRSQRSQELAGRFQHVPRGEFARRFTVAVR